MRQAYQDANAQYMAHVKLTRLIVPKDSQAWNDMKLSGRRRKDMTGWLVQTQAFYQHASAVADLLAQRGITAEELTQAQAQVARVRRDEEREALQQWMSKFIRAARFAFEDDKQQLEALGIVVPS